MFSGSRSLSQNASRDPSVLFKHHLKNVSLCNINQYKKFTNSCYSYDQRKWNIPWYKKRQATNNNNGILAEHFSVVIHYSYSVYCIYSWWLTRNALEIDIDRDWPVDDHRSTFTHLSLSVHYLMQTTFLWISNCLHSVQCNVLVTRTGTASLRVCPTIVIGHAFPLFHLKIPIHFVGQWIFCNDQSLLWKPDWTRNLNTNNYQRMAWSKIFTSVKLSAVY